MRADTVKRASLNRPTAAAKKKKKKSAVGHSVEAGSLALLVPVMRALPREPIYLASQLASVCDVDLKTVHNWCDRPGQLGEPPRLECFRTPGGHLRFRHSAVLRFLTRWGYPIPDALLRDRPHAVIVEPDPAQRRRMVAVLGLARPGEQDPLASEQEGIDGVPDVHGAKPLAPIDSDQDGLGLYANARWYVHLWDDSYAALVAVGERNGANATFDLAVLSVPMAGLDERAWIANMYRGSNEKSRRVVLIGKTPAAHADASILGTVAYDDLERLQVLLDEQSVQLAPQITESVPVASSPGSRKRRTAIAPREPLYVASQVAGIWDVDLKTVHNWVERGDIEAFSTPGRHLRFRRRSLLHFLRRYNMAIPGELAPERPRVLIIDGDPKSAQKMATMLQTSFDVQIQADPIAALTEIGAKCSGADLIDAVVVSFPVAGVDDRRWVRAMSTHPDTRYTRVVVVSLEDRHIKEWQDLGAIATVEREMVEQVAPVLEKALGLGHHG